MIVSAPLTAPAGRSGINHQRVLEVIQPQTNIHHTVELEIGDRLWLKDSTCQITTVSRTELERAGWDIVQAQVARW